MTLFSLQDFVVCKLQCIVSEYLLAQTHSHMNIKWKVIWTSLWCRNVCLLSFYDDLDLWVSLFQFLLTIPPLYIHHLNLWCPCHARAFSIISYCRWNSVAGVVVSIILLRRDCRLIRFYVHFSKSPWQMSSRLLFINCHFISHLSSFIYFPRFGSCLWLSAALDDLPTD